MSGQIDKLMSASLDGELSAAEAAEFDHSLTPAEKANIAAEMKLERGIADRLSQGGRCPDDVWKRTIAALEQEATPMKRVRLAASWRYAITAMAAVLAITVIGAVLRVNQVPQEPSILAIEKGTTIEQLAALSTLSDTDTESLNAFLQQEGFEIRMTTTDVQIPGDHHTPREFLGARPVTYRGEEVIELLFNCCERPVKIVVARTGSRTAHEIGERLAEGQIQVSKPVGEYVAAVVGRHKVIGLLDYLTEPNA